VLPSLRWNSDDKVECVLVKWNVQQGRILEWNSNERTLNSIRLIQQGWMWEGHKNDGCIQEGWKQ